MKVVKTLGMLAGIIGRAMREVDFGQGHGAPVAGETVGAVGAVLVGIGFADTGRCLDVCVVLHDLSVLPGNVLEDAAELVDIKQKRRQFANGKILSRNPFLIN